jgi:hypothetical protein
LNLWEATVPVISERFTSRHLALQEEVSSFLENFTEVIKMQSAKLKQLHQPRIYGLKIFQDPGGGFRISVRHSGFFSLKDYEELDLEVKSARLVRKDKCSTRVY